MPSRRHPKKDVEDALAEAEESGWRVESTRKGHRWGVTRCPEQSRDGCQVSIWSTQRSPENHAKQLRRAVDRCPHKEDDR